MVIWEPWDDYVRVTQALRGGGWNVRRSAVIGAKEPILIYSLTPPNP